MTNKNQQVNSTQTTIAESDSALNDAKSVSPGALTQFKISESLLPREELTILAQAFENAPDGMHITDMTGKIMYANKAIEGVLGFTPEEQKGTNVGELNADKEFAQEHIIPSLQRCGRWEGELLVNHKDGRVLPIWLTTSVVKDERGKPIALTGILRDISELRRIKELSDKLNELNTIINSTLDVSEVSHKVVSTTAEAIGADSAAFFLAEGAHWVLEQVHGPSSDKRGTKIPYDALSPPPRMLENRAPVAISDALNDDWANKEMAQKIGLRSLLLVPLVSSEQVLGMLVFRYFTKQMEFTEEEIDFSTKLGASISLALENARLFSEQQRIASVLQESLLVVPENIPHVEFGHLYRAASDAALVGGDFYDYFALQGDRVGIVIGDVSGKGLDAAAFTSSLKHMIKSYAFEGHSPGAIISKTNMIAMRELDSATFVTAFVGILDTQSGVLTYSCAGHPPPIIKRQNGDIDLLDTRCSPIGVLDFLEPLDKQQPIKGGDLITLYTDGIIEARCASDMFGENRLIEFLRDTTALSAAEVPSRILDELTCCGCTLSDDLAIVSLSLRND